jgi:hypothetical protein
LSEDTLLSDEFLQQITAAGEADILVGIPTFNNARTIEHTIRAVQAGLAKYFPRDRAVVVISDSGSRDGTAKLARNMPSPDFRAMLAAPPLRTMHTLVNSHRPVLGRGGAFRTILAAADLLRAKTCVLVSPDVESITPEWIESLARPVCKENIDFVAPVYLRHKFDGLMVKQILAPFVSAAYGYNVQEPYPAEMAFSGRLAVQFLTSPVLWQEFMPQGAELWMVATAMVGRFSLGQSFLGPKFQPSRPGTSDLSGVIQQAVGTLFKCLEVHQEFWLSQTQQVDVPVFGFPAEVELRPIRIDRKRMFQMFKTGVKELAAVHDLILSKETIREIREAAKLADHQFHLSGHLWARTVYEFAAAYHHSVINRNHILQALTPLYRGRISAFLNELQETDHEDIPAALQALRLQFQSLKPYLIERWKAGA